MQLILCGRYVVLIILLLFSFHLLGVVLLSSFFSLHIYFSASHLSFPLTYFASSYTFLHLMLSRITNPKLSLLLLSHYPHSPTSPTPPKPKPLTHLLLQKFWPLKFAGWRIWPAVSVFNFTFIPVNRRVIVSTAVGLCWNVFLVLFIS